jgi:hypothetical protein
MKTLENIPDTMFTLAKSTPDSNRFYSILLDTRASSVSETMYDIAEKLLAGEKDNAKAALEQLWLLKKNMQKVDEASTIDLLIQHYQTKLDLLRTKEEHIRKVSRDSRTLLEDKRKRDSEVATVKQEIVDCSAEIKELNAKLEKLSVKEQELTLIETQLKKELMVNENEIVNGLYEIILASAVDPAQSFNFAPPAPPAQEQTVESAPPANPGEQTSQPAANDPPIPEFELPQVSMGQKVEANDIIEDLAQTAGRNPDDDTGIVLYKQDAAAEPTLFPKSVVKTSSGRVVGEYYYDPAAQKTSRHYILNSRFFLEQLANSVTSLKNDFSDGVFAELMQMIQDSHKRMLANPSMHYEIATNEILNDKTIKDLWTALSGKDIAEAARFCKRLNAKIAALGSNYRAILKEQMERFSKV